MNTIRSAACRGQTQVFFSDRKDDTALAKAMCATCPLEAPCLEAGLYEPYGVWGGTTPSERSRIRKHVRLQRVSDEF